MFRLKAFVVSFIFSMTAFLASAQTISTFAGGGTNSPLTWKGVGTFAELYKPTAIAVDRGTYILQTLATMAVELWSTNSPQQDSFLSLQEQAPSERLAMVARRQALLSAL